MDRATYNACVAKGLKGKKNLSKEERQLLFCETSKLCSGKASNEEEAKRLCALPKEPKEPKEPKVRRARRIKTCIPCLSEGVKKVLRETVGPEFTEMIDATEICMPGVVLELCPKGVKE